MEQLHLSPFVLGTGDGHLEQATVQLHGDCSVIIPRYGVRHQAGVAVGVNDADGGNVHLGRVSDGHVRLEHVVESGQEDDEVRQADARAVLDGSVGEEAALPVTGVGVLATIPGSGLHQVAELTPAADKQYDATSVRNVSGEVKGELKVLHGLVQVNDVLFQTAPIKIGLH